MNRVLLELLLLQSFYRQTLFVKQGEKNATDKIWKHSIKEGQLNLTSALYNLLVNFWIEYEGVVGMERE